VALQAVGEAQKSVERLVAVRDGEMTRDGDRIRASVAILAWLRDVWEMFEVMPGAPRWKLNSRNRRSRQTATQMCREC
jgi:hypothetical protein